MTAAPPRYFRTADILVTEDLVVFHEKPKSECIRINCTLEQLRLARPSTRDLGIEICFWKIV